MDLQLKGHRAVVTGSSGGIGEAIARRLSAEGAAVVVHGVEEFYRFEASRRSWGDDWKAIEGHILAEVLDNPVGRVGRPEEVADLVAFVASPLAGYINGANLRIDGGSMAVV